MSALVSAGTTHCGGRVNAPAPFLSSSVPERMISRDESCLFKLILNLKFLPFLAIHKNVALIQMLLAQKYRHVDNIMFENHTIADRFLDFWRKTGNQRMGYLYGRYTEHKDIPLGIRAEVAAIYEPPQVNLFSHIECLEPRRQS